MSCDKRCFDKEDPEYGRDDCQTCDGADSGLCPVDRVVMCEITREEILEMKPPVPYAVQVRNRLNIAGFKFEDDGKLGLIANENPVPLGTMSSWTDYETGSIHYQQVLTI